MPRVSALLDQSLGGFLLSANADELVVAGVILAEMEAESALPFLDMLHRAPLRLMV